jgi:hypothetical protein
VTLHEGNWEMMFLGRWKAKLILNDKYEVTNTERVQ